MADRRSPPVGRLARGYARLLVRLRWFVALGWLALVVLAVVALPKPSSGVNLGGLLPQNSPAITAQLRSLTSFDLPLTTGTVVVLSNRDGLSALAQADVVLHALAADQQLLTLSSPYPTDRVLGALPIVDPRDPTAAVTYLYFAPGASINTQVRLAKDYAAHFRTDTGSRTYVTGLSPAQSAQAGYVTGSLTLVTFATLGLVALVVGITFRSVVAPLITLSVAGLAYLATERVLGLLGRTAGVGLPSELAPLVIALLLGVLTDYSVFFLSGLRDRLHAGDERRQAAVTAIAENGPIVLMAGITVASGCAALTVARLQLFRAFGPGLAVTVLVGLVTAVTLVPALMAILGGWVFWPSRPVPLRTGSGRRSSLLVRTVTDRRGAAVAGLATFVVLGLAAVPLVGLKLDLSFISTLPSSSPVRQGVDALTQSFARGITAPTEVLVEGQDVTAQRDALAVLQRELATQPGVATVLGPGDNPLRRDFGVVLSSDGRTARIVLVLDSDPLGAQAVDTLRALQARVPDLAQQAGLHDARIAYAGATAIASEVSRLTVQNLVLILLAAFGVELVLLSIYLRALVAPVYLLASSALTVASALGLSVLVFQHWLGAQGLTFYAPFATAVLLLALGSDYNVFGIGSIWEQARARPLRAAIRVALPGSTRAITAAGLTLAGSFALLVLIPVLTFAEIAFTMAAGLLIDTFLVRSLLTPSLLTLVGTASGWPGHRLHKGPDPSDRQVTAGRTGEGEADMTSAQAGPPPSDAAPTGQEQQVDEGERASAGAARRVRSRTGQALHALLALVLLALLAWGLDAASRLAAQSVVARSIQSGLRLPGRPEVHVRGLFFLPQVVAGHYSEVDVRIDGITNSGLRLAEVSARLHGVRLPLHDVVTSNVTTIAVDSTTETATLTYADLDSYLRSQGYALSVADGGGGDVRLTGSAQVLGQQLAVSADATVVPVSGNLAVRPTSLDTGTAALDAASRVLLGQRLSFVLPTAPLPFGQRVTAVRPQAQALLVDAAGTSVFVARPQ